LTDQNQTQGKSLRLEEFLIGKNSSSADQTGPAHAGSTYKLSFSSFLFFFCFLLFCSFLVTAPSKNGSADFDDLNVKRRGIAQGSAFWGLNASKNFQGVHFPKTPKLGPGIEINPA
jgi:hypothetical protein